MTLGKLSVAALLILPLCLHVGSAQPWQSEARRAMDAHEWDSAIDVLDPVIDSEPRDLHARLLRAISYREKADFVFDELRAQYYLDENEVRSMWRAAQAEVWGEAWDLEYGANYDVMHAMVDFEYILARDSTYDGVLYEYAQLWHDHHVFERAVELGEAQLTVRPDLSEAHDGLIETYRHYVAWTPTDRALAWLKERDTPYARYFMGEVHRLSGDVEGAERVFDSLLAEEGGLPKQALLISLAKLYIAQDRFRAAYSHIEEALAFEELPGAYLLLRDFSYVMDPEEYDRARELETIEEYAGFYDRLWARRDPVPGARVNWRLLEHYRRIMMAERDFAYFGPRRHFQSSPGRTLGEDGALDAARTAGPQATLPAMYYDVHGFNDKGLVYIRHGEPDERVVTQPRPNIDLNESWRYANEGLDFHFFISNIDGTAYSWGLVPYFGGCEMADDRRHWGPLYSQIAPRVDPDDPMDACGDPSDSPIAVIQSRERLAKAGRADIMEGLTTDRHTWTSREVQSFDFPFDIATFRGADGRTDVTAYFAMPIGWFSDAVPSDVLPVSVGFALHDSTWEAAAQKSATLQYTATGDSTEAAFEELHLSVPPDSYRVSLHGELVGSDMLGGYQFGRAVPDYHLPQTMMSDAVLAYDIRPIPGHVPSARSSLQFIANPFHRFSTEQPLHVYFELYNLALDENDLSHYEVTYRVQADSPGGIRRLFSRDEPALSVSAEFEDATPSPIVLSQIDITELEPGGYTLVVLVEDLLAGTTMERTKQIELTGPDS